ncbi:hypothetical protein JA1_003505 [Spathaspora sp. JA1]|nr:hypothetical protein JA1_003505 [Spathaspora sp. JA1]
MALVDGLVGTPQRTSLFGRGTRNQEFTPIGEKRQTGGFQVIHSYPGTNRPPSTVPKLFKPIVSNSPRGLVEEEFSQSFYDDETIDKFDHPPVNRATAADAKYVQPRSFVNDGEGISTKQSEERIKQLNAENFSWRLKFMELKKYLDSVPKHDRELMLENVELKDKIVELTNKLEVNFRASQGNSEYEKIISEKNIQIDRLAKQVEAAEHDIHELESRYQSELQQQREKYSRAQATGDSQAQQHIQDLEHELEQVKSKLERENSKLHQELNQELEQVKSKLGRENSKLHQELNHELEDLHHQHKLDNQEISRLQQQIERLSEQHSKINDNDVQLRQERNQLLNQEREFNNKVSDLQRQLRDKLDLEQVLESKSNDLESKLYNKSIEISNLQQNLQQKSKEIIDLEKQVKYLQSKDESGNQKDIEISRLKSKLKQVENSLSEGNSNQELQRNHLIRQLKEKDTEISKLKSQLNKSGDDQDKIRFYEQEYELIERKLQDKQQEVLNWTNKLNKLEQEKQEQSMDFNSRISKLNQERKDFVDKLNSYENKFEHLQQDKEDLAQDNQELRASLSKFKHELTTRETSSTGDLLNLQYDNRELTQKISSLEMKLDEFQTKNRTLVSELEDIDSSYRSLKNEYETLRQTRSYSREHDELVRDNQVLVESLTNAKKLVESKSREITQLQLLIEDSKLSGTRFNSQESVSELMKEISQLKDTLRDREFYIDKIIEETRSEHDQFKNSQVLLDEYERKIKTLEDKISQNRSPAEEILELKYDAANKKVNKLTEEIIQLKTKQDSEKSTIIKLELERKSLQDELAQYEPRYKQLTREQERLVGKVSNLDEELEQMTRRCRLMALKAHDYKQEILMKKTNPNDYQDKFTILEKETIYYRAKLRDVMLRANDFRMMYTYVIASIKGNNSLMFDGESNLVKLGIYPEYVGNKSNPPKITFKGLAKFVLAGIRLKNRTKKSKFRNKELKSLKNEVECGKIQLEM